MVSGISFEKKQDNFLGISIMRRVSKSVNESVNQSVSQLASQPESKSVNQKKIVLNEFFF